jgi:2-polyprenyl-6-methoxyphenol hydroxylase-like FAD-dependent oxidoreductase
MTLASVRRYRGDRIPTLGDHAVVVGGSVAGLLAARVLADGFDRVTVLEKDTFPEEAEPRRGVPQGSHIHALQEAGRATIEDLFPGYCEDLVASGALLVDATTDLKHYMEGDFLADGTTRMPSYSATRPLFEAVLRRRLGAVEGVTIREECQVTEFVVDDEATTVGGVRIRDGRGGANPLPADLVVDATGRTSRTPEWLADHGYRPPRVEEVEIDVAYSTIAVRRPPTDRRAILQVASYPHTRGCGVFPVEDDLWLVNLHGVHGDWPPTELDDFAAFAETLPIPHAKRTLASGEFAWDEPEFYPYPSNLRRHYEKLERFPDGLLVLGDAVASFNPIYGQGMSVAALEALELHHTLAAGGREDLAHRFFARAADVVDLAWAMAVGADHRYAETTGPKPRGSDLFTRYFSRVGRAAHHDGHLRDELMRVLGMERPPTHLLRPSVVARVVRSGLSLPTSGRSARPDDRSESATGEVPGMASR